MQTLSQARRCRLHFDSLESRDVPAGSVTASISGGVLILTGDDLANSVTIKRTATDVVITPDATTSVNGMAANTAVTVTGVASSLKANLKDGNDTLAIDAFGDLVMSGGASIKLGSGNDTLLLETEGIIDLGSLIVTGGADNDFVSVQAGLGTDSRVAGKASFKFGTGEADAEFANIGFYGSDGVFVTASGSGTNTDIAIANVTISNKLKADLKATFGTLEFDSSSIGDLSIKASDATIDAIDSTVFGDLSVTATNGPVLRADSLVVTELVSLKSTSLSGSVFASFKGDSEVKGIKLRGSSASLSVGEDVTDGLSVAGDIMVSGNKLAAFDFADGSLIAHNVRVSSPRGDTFLDAFGNDFNLSGDLIVSGGITTTVNLDTTEPSQIAGHVKVNGGSQADRILISSKLRVRDRVDLNLKNGDNQVSIGDANGDTEIDGKLSIMTGSGNDLISLQAVAIGNLTVIITGSGNDNVSLEDGTTFAKSVRLDLGAGNDTLSIAQNLGSAGAVTFNGKSTLRLGLGDDTLRLGRSLAAGGDANSRVVFNATGSVVDGGGGIDGFVAADAQFFGVSPTSTE